MKKFLLLSAVVLFSLKSFSQCAQAIYGNYYMVYDSSDSGPGTLRQAILDANFDNVGGAIVFFFGYDNPINIFSPLPFITCDSLVVNFSQNIIDANFSAPDPPLTVTAPHSCVGSSVLYVNFIGTTYWVTTDSDSGAGSLRQAILNCNVTWSYDNINFNIPGIAPHKILLASNLPTIIGPVTIDGTSQPANGYIGTNPKIELDGTSINNSGLRFDQGSFQFIYPYRFDAAVYGMYIHSFHTAVSSNGMRQLFIGAANKKNVISGNSINGLYSYRDSNVVIENNYIGLTQNGDSAYGNMQCGIYIFNPVNEGIHIIKDNIISGNNNAIWLPGGDNYIIKGNKIGTDVTGSFAIPNSSAIMSLVSNLTIGGTSPNDGNLISGNILSPISSGIIECHGFPCIIQKNKIGTNLSGNDTIPNVGLNIYLQSCNGSLIGGTSASARNVIAGNSNSSAISIVTSKNIVVQNNFIGTDILGSISYPNLYGISIFSCFSDSNTIQQNKITSINTGISIDGCNNNINNKILDNTIYNCSWWAIGNGGRQNLFSHNSIFDNAVGIIQYGYANDNIPKPILTSCTPTGVIGNALPDAKIELYNCQSQNNTPQGKTLITNLTADSVGNWQYNGTIANVLKVTATQTDSSNNTSEFSDLWQVVTPDVWPGDCNYDLTVDNVDFLYLNIAMNDTGAARNGATINWLAQPATNWAHSFNIGANHKHADTNGNGVVDLNDTVAILQNYNLQHSFRLSQPQTNNSLPAFYIHALEDTVASGDTVHYEIQLSNFPVDSVYGIAYSLSYNNSLVDSSFFQINYSPSTLGIIDSTMASFEKPFYSTGMIDVAICRFNQTNATNVSGTIGTICVKAQTSAALSYLNLKSLMTQGITFNQSLVVFDLLSDTVVIINCQQQVQPTFIANGNLLTSSSAINNQWYLNGSSIAGAVQTMYIITTSGWYMVAVTDSLGCVAFSDSVWVSPVGLDEQYEQTIYVSPNPFTENLSLTLANEEGNAACKIFAVKIVDMLGKVVYSITQENPTSNIVLETTNCAAGVFELQVICNDKIFRKKIVKQ